MDLGPLGNRYVIVRPIGGGAVTTVLEAWDRLAQSRVALKVPVEPLVGDEAFLDRLQRETWAAAEIAHPNVAGVHALERDGRAAFLVAELVDGSSLRDMLAARGPLPPVGAARVAAGACAAVAAAHAQGVTHGHLTPANVLLTIDGQVKVTDFRLAQAARPLADDTPSLAADLRALGRCLAAMLTGREPVDGEPAQLDPTIPVELATIVARAASGPQDAEGYRSAADLGRDLVRFLALARSGGATRVQHRAAPAHESPAPLAAGSSPATDLVAGSAAGLPDRLTASGDVPPPARRRRRRTLVAGLVAAGVVVSGVGTAVGLLTREAGRPAVGQVSAPPSTTILATTSGQPATTAPSTTEPPTTAPTTTAVAQTSTSVEVAAPGQRIVPSVVGLHRERAADVLAKAQLGMQVLPVPVRESGKVQRVVAQQPAAGQLLPSGSEVIVLVGTRRPNG